MQKAILSRICFWNAYLKMEDRLLLSRLSAHSLFFRCWHSMGAEALPSIAGRQRLSAWLLRPEPSFRQHLIATHPSSLTTSMLCQKVHRWILGTATLADH